MLDDPTRNGIWRSILHVNIKHYFISQYKTLFYIIYSMLNYVCIVSIQHVEKMATSTILVKYGIVISLEDMRI
jgi:hypothetical protein